MGPTKNFSFITDEESPAAVAALAAIVGEVEAAKPSWLRRLVRLLDTNEFGLAVRECASLSKGDAAWNLPWTAPNALLPVEVGYSLAEGIALLQGPDNPEAELERRRRLVEEHAAAVKAREDEDRRRTDQAAAALVRVREDGEKYHARDWQVGWTEIGRTLLAVALLCEARDPVLANDLRIVAEGQRSSNGSTPTRPLPFPRTVAWFGGPTSSPGWQWWLRATDKPST
jgi:hypothetical protein